MLLEQVKINGYIWFVDINKRILYELNDINSSYVRFESLTSNELKQLTIYIKYNR